MFQQFFLVKSMGQLVIHVRAQVHGNTDMNVWRSDVTFQGGRFRSICCVLLFQEHKKFVSLSEVEAKVKYTHLCRSLKTYGITFFLVKVRIY